MYFIWIFIDCPLCNDNLMSYLCTVFLKLLLFVFYCQD